MAAYAALLSLLRLVEQVQRHSGLSVSFGEKHMMESIHDNLTFFILFLESDSHGHSKEAQDLESRITEAAYAAEDIIETHMVDNITTFSTSTLSSSLPGIEKVVETMEFIKEDVMKINNNVKGSEQVELEIPVIARSMSREKYKMVGCHDELTCILERLTGTQSRREIIPIVGMGGIGKTTLAKAAYYKPIIVQHFDVRTWVSISQVYDRRQILLGLLSYQIRNDDDYTKMKELSDVQLVTRLYQSLCGVRYLVVLDDMWSIEAWDMIRSCFPDYSDGSRIVVTTRLSKVATDLNLNGLLKMDFLDEDTSWKLLCEKAFVEQGCPPELDGIGRQIAKNCKGLPLSIVVIGGLLAKSKRTKELWEYVARDTNSVINMEDDKHCMNLLSLSYHNLPVHLKPCFLYMGAFPEDKEIRTSWLINLWIAEGFLKPDSSKPLEVVGEEYLKDLIGRNLLLVHTLGSNGNIKLCNIHDLLRDLCLREARKEKFMYVPGTHDSDTGQSMTIQRRISIYEGPSKEEHLSQVLTTRRFLTRSFICDFCSGFPFQDFRLLRVLKMADKSFPFNEDGKYQYLLSDVFHLVNSRYIAVKTIIKPTIPSSICMLRNLQMLTVRGTTSGTVAPSEIWEMTELRLIEFDALHLPDPPCQQMDGQDNVALVNLQKLSGIVNFRLSDEVIKRIPNLRKLNISYSDVGEGFDEYCFKNLGLLRNLESLNCSFVSDKQPSRTVLQRNLDFPCSLKKLALHGCRLSWEDMTLIGSLRHLEVLKLKYSFDGPEWIPVEGEFSHLKYLLLTGQHLKYWTADSNHFPCLQHLVLDQLKELEEIPSGIGEIDTLQSIEVKYCSVSVANSAKQILDDQEELENHSLHVSVHLWEKSELESLASDNFRVQVCHIL